MCINNNIWFYESSDNLNYLFFIIRVLNGWHDDQCNLCYLLKRNKQKNAVSYGLKKIL